ncbi:DDB1- and CUL4-associated factor 10 homolog [Uranotaenia lowii]|uniref:DDB1- and CUL4-associated factor 10 homolog n=1 Tax=Uranotaenia lowii TaxID=190385 RepID=UPI0024787D5B|nr:DDB1- and CUL4-associated factor 10 homolog [Uranotaenia lowii]
MTLHSLLRRRESGFPVRFGDGDAVHRAIYYSLEPKKSWNDQRNACNTCEYGGAYNLEFSPDGSILVAACEKKTIVLFDPITEKQMCTIKNAHNDSVNCVKFLDNRMFATCSDDSTVALWDTRNLKSKIRSLHGHSNWVKNIEYSKKDCLLVTSGFDGSIFTWDINSYTEHGFVYQKVFYTPGLMRCRLVPDENRLVICTTGGYLIIIHNLNLASLAKDLRGFRPNLYRLMQLRHQFIPNAARYDHAFSRKQKYNRVELVTDFPEGNDAEVISSLQIHPQGWCALSRNMSYDESSEWSCVHDIQELTTEDEEMDSDSDEDGNGNNGSEHRNQDSSTAGEGGGGGGGGGAAEGGGSAAAAAAAALVNAAVGEPTVPEPNRLGAPPAAAAGVINAEFPTPNSDIWAAEVSLRNRNLRAENTRSLNMTNVYGITSGLVPLSPAEHQQRFQQTITVNVNRMLYYIEEPNKGKGFIKEPCFSADGRIICSPHGCGIRLLAFNERCNELPFITDRSGGGPVDQQGPIQPKPLYEIKTKHCHSDVVVSSKFSPKFPLLVSGCLRGKIVWHQPVL